MSKAGEWAERLLDAQRSVEAAENARPVPAGGLPYLTGFGRIGFLCSDHGWPKLVMHPNSGVVEVHEYKWAEDIEALKKQCRWVLDTFGEPSA